MIGTTNYFRQRGSIFQEHWKAFLGELGAYLLIAFFLAMAGFTLDEDKFVVKALLFLFGEAMVVAGVLVLLWRCLFSRFDRSG